MRHICYISGTRADFGLMRRTLDCIREHPELRLSVLATGMHLSPLHGETIKEIEAAGMDIGARIAVPVEPATGATMARNIATMLSGFIDAMEADRPDVVLLLGDRGEMLAGAMAGIHLNIPVAHIAGGERSGTVDEPVRHAISKLSHLHFTSTEGARERLIRMGELAEHIHVVGAPGVDGLTDGPLLSRAEVMRGHGLDPNRPFALMVYHPVLQEADDGGADAACLLDALAANGCQVLALMPNSDAGADGVRSTLLAAGGSPDVVVLTHLARDAFLQAMAVADVMIGNSSSGIIEAASFGTPVLNIGRRQNLRERNANTTDLACTPEAVSDGLKQALTGGRFPPANVYRADGQAGRSIARLLAEAALDPALLRKVNAY